MGIVQRILPLPPRAGEMAEKIATRGPLGIKVHFPRTTEDFKEGY